MPSEADAVVVGGGAIGGWCAYFLKKAGLDRVVLIEKATLGSGASSRSAGMVRAQGGTEVAVRLAVWSREFYLRQRAEIGVDSGFVAQGYLMPVFGDEEIELARARVEMQHAAGLEEVVLLSRAEVGEIAPILRKGVCSGGTFAPGDGYLDAARNVLAYTTALHLANVEVHEQASFVALSSEAGGCVVEATVGVLRAPRVVLTGGPELGEVAGRAGVLLRVGAVRHQVAVTAPRTELAPDQLGPMVFDIAEGLYWRPEDGGLLFGMSNPKEAPGPARGVDFAYLEHVRRRLGELVPLTRSLPLQKVWAATVEYTADHLPILGPAIGTGGVLPGVFVVSAGGHGMMIGPGLARAAADAALGVRTSIADVSMLGMDRFDSEGRSRLAADPVALPFPRPGD